MPPAPSQATCTEPAEPAPAAGGLTPATPIACRTLHATVPASCCILRQLMSERQRTRDVWRGQGSDHPSCTYRCAQGVAIRAAVTGVDLVKWRGAGPGGRFERGRTDAEEQYRARKRQEAGGLLDPVPTLDHPPGQLEPEGHDLTRPP